MPKVINQTGVSFDSLQAKLTLLEKQFSNLTTEHKSVLDSLRSLDKTIQKADIKTDFFSDQLAFQLFIFSCIIAVLAFFSWALILRPFQNKIKEISTVTIPKLDVDLKQEFADRFNNLNKDIEKNNALLYKGYISSLRTAVQISMLANGVTFAFLNLITSIALDIKFHGKDSLKSGITSGLNYAKSMLESPNFSFSHLATIPESKELEEYLVFLTKHEDNEIAIQSFKLWEIYLNLKANSIAG